MKLIFPSDLSDVDGPYAATILVFQQPGKRLKTPESSCGKNVPVMVSSNRERTRTIRKYQKAGWRLIWECRGGFYMYGHFEEKAAA